MKRFKLPKALSPGLMNVLTIGIVLAVLQQWSGINIIFNYAEEIYRSARGVRHSGDKSAGLPTTMHAQRARDESG